MKLDKCLSAKSESGLEIFIETTGRNFDKFPKRGCLIEMVYMSLIYKYIILQLLASVSVLLFIKKL